MRISKFKERAEELVKIARNQRQIHRTLVNIIPEEDFIDLLEYGLENPEVNKIYLNRLHYQKNNVPPHTKVCGLNGTCFLDDPKLKPASYYPILKNRVLIYGHNKYYHRLKYKGFVFTTATDLEITNIMDYLKLPLR